MKITEAVLVIPLTILITVSLITLMMNFYSVFISQTEENCQEISRIYEKSDSEIVRIHQTAERFTE